MSDMYDILLYNKSILSNYSRFLRSWFFNTTENSNNFKFLFEKKRESIHYIYHFRISLP